MLAHTAARARSSSDSKWMRTETQTSGNAYGHRFTVPVEVYSDEKYREKLDRAKTLNEAESIIRDYRKHHLKK
jgi:hypothetical protein